MEELEDFREQTRDWLETNCPPTARGAGYVPTGSKSVDLHPEIRLWLERMIEKGWTVPTWPKQYGGGDLGNDEYRVLIEELKRIDARPPLTGRGVNYIGPTILEFGTDDQKARWLPICARGQGAWAMGYSEPGAGSDLASLSTRAEKRGDQYWLNGRKTWTSDAYECDYIFVLVRTSPKKPKHEGISLILVDMHQEGVSVSPIPLLSGASPFCETVFEDAVASSGDIIGGLDNGWTVGKRLLQFERSTHAGINISGAQGGLTQDSRLPDLVRKYVGASGGCISDFAMRERLLKYEMNTKSQQITQRRAIEELEARAPAFTSSAVKLTNALNIQAGDELLMDSMGPSGYRWDVESGATKEELKALRNWLYQKSLTIAGGTKEIQLNIIAKRVLGLPD